MYSITVIDYKYLIVIVIVIPLQKKKVIVLVIVIIKIKKIQLYNQLYSDYFQNFPYTLYNYMIYYHRHFHFLLFSFSLFPNFGTRNRQLQEELFSFICPSLSLIFNIYKNIFLYLLKNKISGKKKFVSLFFLNLSISLSIMFRIFIF